MVVVFPLHFFSVSVVADFSSSSGITIRLTFFPPFLIGTEFGFGSSSVVVLRLFAPLDFHTIFAMESALHFCCRADAVASADSRVFLDLRKRKNRSKKALNYYF